MLDRRLSVRSRLLASVMVGFFPATVFAADTTVGSGQTVGQVQFAGSDHVTVQAGGTVSTTGQSALVMTGNPTGAIIDNAGTITTDGPSAIDRQVGAPAHTGPLTINNSGTIQSPGAVAIQFSTAMGALTINNSGVISGSTAAILTGSGADTLNLSTGSAITGRVDLGDGADAVNLAGTSAARTTGQVFGNIFGAEAINVNSGYWTLNRPAGVDVINLNSQTTLEIDRTGASPSERASLSSTSGGQTTIKGYGSLVINTNDTRIRANSDFRIEQLAGLEVRGGGVVKFPDTSFSNVYSTVTDGTLIVNRYIQQVTVGAQGTLRLGAAFSAPDADGYVTIVPGGGGFAGVDGRIFNSGLVIYDLADNWTQTTVISGTGAVTKEAAATLTLTGDNTYTGLTTVRDGTLQVGSGTKGSIVSDVLLEGDAVLAFGRTDASAYGGHISGTGGLLVNGGGYGSSLLYTGTATHTGGTNITTGSALYVGAGGSAGSLTGNIANEGYLGFNRSDTSTFAGSVTGSGDVGKIGTGTLIVTGSLASTRGLAISRGVVQVGNGGTTGSISGSIGNNGMLIFDRSDDYVQAGLISGAGAVVKNGGGKVTLLADNSYFGGTTINAGILEIGGGGTTGSLQGNIANNAVLAFNRSDSVTFNGVVSGAGAVTKSGAGVLTLSGPNTYTGATTVTGGGLVISAPFASSGVSLSGGTSLTFASAGATSYGGVVSGSGSLVKTGAGVLTLSGANTFTGATTVSGGGVVVSAPFASSGVSLAGGTNLTFTGPNALTYAGAVSGAGSLTKTGSGVLTLSGASTHTGGTNVTGGGLTVSGSLVGLATLAAGTSLNITSSGSARVINGDGATVTNAGTIDTPLVTTGALASVTFGNSGSTFNNSGLVRSYNNYAVRFGAGNDTLNLTTGSIIIGRVDLGGGADTINLSGSQSTKTPSQGFGNMFGAEVTNVNSGYWTLGQELGTDQVNIASGATLELNTAGATPGFGGFITPSGSSLTVVNNGAVINNTTDARFNVVTDTLHLSGSGTMELKGGGSMAYGQNVTLTGRTTITQGTLVVTGDNVAGPFTVTPSGILRVGAAFAEADAEGYAAIVSGGGATGTLRGDMLNNGQVYFDRAGDVAYAGNVSGNGIIRKLNAGVLTLSGSNSGNLVNVQQGGVILSGLHTGRTQVAPGTSVTITSSGSSGRINGLGATVTNAGLVDTSTLTTGTLASIDLTTNPVMASTVNNSGVIRSYNGNAIRFGGADDTLNLATGSAITGSVFMGAGSDTVNLAGTSNTRASTQTFGRIFEAESVNVNSGYWTLLGELGTDAVSIASGATLDIDDVTAVGGAFLSSGAPSLTIANSGAVVLNTADNRLDIFADNLRLSGSGTLQLTGGGMMQYGANVSMTGATTVTNGTVIVTGDNIASPFNVGAQGTLRIGAAYSTPDADGFVNLVSGGGTTGSVSGAIANHGAVIFDRSNASTYAGSMSGTGAVTKSGAGVLTLTGANTYTGATTVNGGGLVVAGPFASTGVSLASGTGLTFASPNALTYAGVVSGAGILTKAGAGVTTLSGANTYSGPTTVSAGGLTVTGSIASQAISVGSGANFTFGSAADQTFGGVVSGAGSLGKSGAGALTLTGANTYTGGTSVTGGSLILASTLASNVTVAQGGTLQIGTGGTTGSLTGNLAANGTVIFNRSDNYVYAGAFSGNGSLIKRGAGLLTLDGLYTFSGTTTIEAGTIKITQLDAGGSLVVGSGSTVDLSGSNQTVGGLAGGTGSTVNIQNATLTINQAPSTTPTVFGGSLTGSGALVVTGSGVIDLAGANTYTGPTTVSGGTLKVNGSITSPVTVNSGGTLGGSGTIGGAVTIGSGGSLSPGNSPGVTTIAGPLTLASGASMIVEVDPTATIKNDRVNVTAGAATIVAGAKLDVRPLGAIANYERVNDYVILTATGGVNGTFGANVTSTMALLTPSVSYSTNQVSLRLIRNDISFASLADTANQSAVASAAEAGGPSGAAYGALVGQDAAGARAGYDALSGELYGTANSLMIDDGRHQRAAMLRQAASSEGGAWATLHNGDTKADAGAGHAEGRNRASGLMGGGQMNTGAWNVGVAVGFSDSDIAVADRASVTSVETLRAGVYGGTGFGAWRLRLGADVAKHEFDGRRGIEFPTVSETVRADYDGSTRQLFGELAYAVDVAGGSLEPFVELAGVWSKTDGFTETGGTLGLSVAEEERNVTFATVGARFSGSWETGGAVVRPQLSLAWRRAGGDIEGTSTAALGSSSFTVMGAGVAKDTTLIDAGVGFDITSSVTASVSYSGALSSEAKDNAVRAGLFVRF